MNILIVGCGTIGIRLAQLLAADGHDVSVVDEREENLRLLGVDFPGYTTLGLPIDQDTLRRAGVENCDALAAVCAEDNINMMVGQIAKEIFHMPNVLVRIYDPQKEEVYSGMGMQTFCPTNLNAAMALDILLGEKSENKLRFGNHMLHFYEVKAPRQVWECDVSFVELSEHHFLFAVQRPDNSLTVCTGQKLMIHKGDTLIVGVNVD